MNGCFCRKEPAAASPLPSGERDRVRGSEASAADRFAEIEAYCAEELATAQRALENIQIAIAKLRAGEKVDG